MPKRSSKRPDEQLAQQEQPVPAPQAMEKNPAAVELGRLGGLKGGKARAAKLSKKKLIEIARKAAQARWSKKAQGEDSGSSRGK
jgi:hypothetical protein